MVKGNFKTGNQHVSSISINKDLHDWCKQFARERGIPFSQLVEQQLRRLYVENNGIFLAPGDKSSI